MRLLTRALLATNCMDPLRCALGESNRSGRRGAVALQDFVVIVHRPGHPALASECTVQLTVALRRQPPFQLVVDGTQIVPEGPDVLDEGSSALYGGNPTAPRRCGAAIRRLLLTCLDRGGAAGGRSCRSRVASPAALTTQAPLASPASVPVGTVPSRVVQSVPTPTRRVDHPHRAAIESAVDYFEVLHAEDTRHGWTSMGEAKGGGPRPTGPRVASISKPLKH